MDNLLQNKQLVKNYLFAQNKPSKLVEESFSSYKESDRMPTIDARDNSRRRRDYANDAMPGEDKVHQEKFVAFLQCLTRIMKDRAVGGVHGSDDSLDYQAISCVAKLFKLNKA